VTGQFTIHNASDSCITCAIDRVVFQLYEVHQGNQTLKATTTVSGFSVGCTGNQGNSHTINYQISYSPLIPNREYKVRATAYPQGTASRASYSDTADTSC
jgi:hypothetical protein